MKLKLPQVANAIDIYRAFIIIRRIEDVLFIYKK